ncbi:F0F1 ATP synthase subunit gamma [Fructilactobacillus lindneri]|uniref:ATP synthase gamma chain n=2 Tax=Fructilactobacillus lindneri TaxID=53444 RepID=A0A0R2JV14_9LACO|nr:F0F1 ATP synthase subunit gamma [Fructilactobacillus lindneri]ANZ59691.1 F0F1 ATP synthase subunit gamma [Fructilactobacillus lindneri]KRN79205.1 ATP synthase subunit gamma [Fructilactobacillus lindneri DSM 20690 = JCM 11027]POG98526.1 F0F1 ATP synthase subunit gamma [Fructilactobacillus lindneri]POH03914.1 F0F1 ATP synthase subunit gamma [Fructilactobacillus lindneri]POH04843.1 F0F1 ATP synthase subunit gamma [Fructilactobacillus lindneri]
MAGMNEVKHRIASTKSTRQITEAMEMVQTVKLNQIQGQTETYNTYVSKIKSVVMHLAQSHMLDNHKPSRNKADNSKGKTAYLVITSDRGMVGSYNSSVLRGTNRFIEQHTPNQDDYVIMAVGGTGADFYKKNGANIAYEYRGVSDIPTFNEVKGIVKAVSQMYNDGVFTELYVCYNHFVNRVKSDYRAEKLLPMDRESIEQSMNGAEGAGSDVKTKVLSAEYEVEPSEEEVLNAILPQYAESLVYGAILDAKTAEHSSSSMAMKAATDNADDLISSLELKYNRARQAAITTEITEITGGQEALNH